MFTVTITKTTIEERPAGKEWQVVKGCRAEGTAEYGYTPEIVKKKEVDLKIYEQTVNEIDVKRVIDAVNCPPETLIDPRHILSESESRKVRKNNNK